MPRIIILFTFLLKACVSSQPYPDEWGELPSGEFIDCTHFEGVYHYRENDQPAEASLGRLFKEDKRLIRTTNESGGSDNYLVGVLMPSKDVMKVSVWRVGDAEYSGANQVTLYSKWDQFSCEEGHLVIKQQIGDSDSSGTRTVVLYQTDNYLVVKVKETALNMLYILPIPFVMPAPSSEVKWHRFKRLPL